MPRLAPDKGMRSRRSPLLPLRIFRECSPPSGLYGRREGLRERWHGKRAKQSHPEHCCK